MIDSRHGFGTQLVRVCTINGTDLPDDKPGALRAQKNFALRAQLSDDGLPLGIGQTGFVGSLYHAVPPLLDELCLAWCQRVPFDNVRKLMEHEGMKVYIAPRPDSRPKTLLLRAQAVIREASSYIVWRLHLPV